MRWFLLRRALLPLLLTLFALLSAGCTFGGGSDDRDGDGDGVPDRVEEEGREIEITRLDGTVERRKVTADPALADTDGDGLGDLDEMLARGTDPRDVDTDGDGLLDGGDQAAPDAATASAWAARALVSRDGVFLGELDACPPGFPPLKPAVVSSDLPQADGLADGEELRGWSVTIGGETRAVTSDPCVPDTDEDGLRDHEEKAVGSDPRRGDTDSDGVPDGQDADPLGDLGIRFEIVGLTRADGAESPVRVRLAGAETSEMVYSPALAVVPSTFFDVPDQGLSRDSLETSLTVAAEDAETGEALALFEDPRGAIVTLDVLADEQGGVLDFEGEDGTLSLRWTPARR